MCMLLWPKVFPSYQSVLEAGVWLRSTTLDKEVARRESRKDRTLSRWRATLKDLTTQILARAGVDRALWISINYPLRPRKKPRAAKVPEVEEVVTEDVQSNYDQLGLYLPALAAGHMRDGRIDGHACEAIRKWEAKDLSTLLVGLAEGGRSAARAGNPV